MPEEPEFQAPRLPIFSLLDWARQQVTGRTAKCPACAEPIRPDAMVCPHCRRDLTS